MTIHLSAPDLIIFDCDGTPVDSEKTHTQIFVDMLHDYGVNVTFDEVHLLTAAQTLARDYEIMRDHFRVKDFDEDLYVHRYKEALLNEGPGSIAIEGALECVIDCSQKTKIAIGTNGEVDLTDIKLRGCGYFDALPDLKVFTKDLVKNPKPAPDLFLHIAKELNVLPKNTWVIEDSVTGVTAAKGAGMHIIGFTGAHEDQKKATEALKMAGADLIIGTFSDFPEYD